MRRKEGLYRISKKMNISIIIPVYNEENRIATTLKKIITYMGNNFIKYEIIIVDDCSDDKTNKIISKYKKENVRILRHNSNKGKGYSVKRSILNSKGSAVLFTDCDLATPIEEFKKFIRHMVSGYDIIIGLRNLKESNIKTKQPFYRRIMGKFFPILVSMFVLSGFKDTQCGFKLFRGDVVRNIVKMQTLNGFSFDVELLLIAKKKGYKIKEVPVLWIDKKGSKVKPIRDGFKMFIDLFKIKYNDLLGKYG